jgi:hypothetical protein
MRVAVAIVGIRFAQPLTVILLACPGLNRASGGSFVVADAPGGAIVNSGGRLAPAPKREVERSGGAEKIHKADYSGKFVQMQVRRMILYWIQSTW